jgi:hypothetical protein
VLNRSSTIVPKTGTKQIQAIRVGAKYFGAVVSTTSATGTKDWYKRDEKNDWRPIASHMFDNIAAPPWYRETAHSNQPKPFHFSKLRREEDIRKARKKRRRQWMVKAYLLSTTGATSLTAGNKSSNLDQSYGHKDTGYNPSDEKPEYNYQRVAEAKNTPEGRIITNNYRQHVIKQPVEAPMSESKYDEKSSSNSANDHDHRRAAAADFKRGFAGNESASQASSRGLLNLSESLLQSKISNTHFGGQYPGSSKAANNNNSSTAQQLLRSSYGLDENSLSTAGSRVKNQNNKNTASNTNAYYSATAANSVKPAMKPPVDTGPTMRQSQAYASPPRKQRYDAAADQYVDLVDWRYDHFLFFPLLSHYFPFSLIK